MSEPGEDAPAPPASIGRGLRAALLLLRGRADGIDLIDADTLEGARATARHSFVAMALCLPAFLALRLLGPAAAETGMLRGLTAAVLGWLGFAVLSHHLAGLLGRSVLWPRFIATWNWCNLVQYLLLAAAQLPAIAGLPAPLAQAVWMGAIGWAVWLEWFATRLALGLPGGTAALLVAIDLLLGLVAVLVVGSG